MKGGRFTGRGAGTPVRAPQVCRKVTDVGVTTGSGRRVGNTTAANVIAARPRRSVVEPTSPSVVWS